MALWYPPTYAPIDPGNVTMEQVSGYDATFCDTTAVMPGQGLCPVNSSVTAIGYGKPYGSDRCRPNDAIGLYFECTPLPPGKAYSGSAYNASNVTQGNTSDRASSDWAITTPQRCPPGQAGAGIQTGVAHTGPGQVQIGCAPFVEGGVVMTPGPYSPGTYQPWDGRNYSCEPDTWSHDFPQNIQVQCNQGDVMIGFRAVQTDPAILSCALRKQA